MGVSRLGREQEQRQGRYQSVTSLGSQEADPQCQGLEEDQGHQGLRCSQKPEELGREMET